MEADHSRKRNPNLNIYPKLKLKGKKADKCKNLVHLDSIVEKSKEDDEARSELTLEAEKVAFLPDYRLDEANFELLQTIKAKITN